MKKIFKTLAVLAAVAALGFGFVSCGDSGDDNNGSGSPSSGDGNGGGGNSTTAVTKETIAPKNFKVEQVEGQNKLKFTWEAGTVEAECYDFFNEPSPNLLKRVYNGETSFTIDWYVYGEYIARDSGEYEFTLVAQKWSDEAASTILADPISASVNFEAKAVVPTVPENIEAYQEEGFFGGACANLNFDKINNNGNYWLWYVSTTNDINTAVIRGLTETSTSSVRFRYDEGEVPANGTTVYVWIKSAVKYIRTEGNEAGSGYYFIKADSDTYSAPTEPFTFVWNLNTGN